MLSFGERFKTARLSTGLTQEDFASRSGLSRQTISQVEREQQKPSMETIAAYAETCPISADWLVLGRHPESEEVTQIPSTPQAVTPVEALQILQRALTQQPGDESAVSQLAELRAENAALKKELEALRARAPSRKFGQDKNHTPPRKIRGSDQKQTGS